jgi:isopenicillin N synthase-like dioxygenase
MTSHNVLPSFPSDLPSAPILTISSASLLSHSPSATSSLLSACQTSGFFYLDLNDSIPGQALISQSESSLSLARKIFALPDNVKQSHHLEKGKSLFGYKAAGTVKTTDPSARKDSTEFMNVAKDHVFGVTEARTYPEEIWQEKELFEQFMKGCHGIGLEVLRALARGLGLDDEEEFVKLNRFDMPSGDHVRLTRKMAQQEEGALGLPSHTDFGSETVLFNWLGGLQIEDRREGMGDEWVWVRPLAGHAVVNLGELLLPLWCHRGET